MNLENTFQRKARSPKTGPKKVQRGVVFFSLAENNA